MKGRGKPIGKGHKGQHRRFTNFEEIEAQQKKLAKQAEWRKQRGDDEEEDEDASDEDGSKNDSDTKSDSDSDEEESGEEDSEEEAKPKGVESLIEVQNPNRVLKKAAPEVKAGTSTDAKPEMSRKEREEAERQRRAQTVNLKTEQARADLARLALIKQQRETARLKREAELKAKEAEKKAKEGLTK